ncbi:MAG: tetratricopeptide repeat protein [Bacteroidetes bacterium]|nr:tetratricopeptide repeat protein [Bacteroidota bacterium]
MNKLILFITAIILSLTSLSNAQTDAASVQLARTYTKKQEWAKAIEAYKSLIEKDKYNGEFLNALAEAYYNNKNYKESIEAYKKTLETGYLVDVCSYNTACCYALMGDADNAVKWLSIAASYKYRNLEDAIKKDKDFDKIRNHEKFKEMVTPDKYSKGERTERWKSDIAYLKKRMEETHYNVFEVLSKEQWENEFSNLLEKVDAMDDEHIMTGIAKIIASVGDGHTILFPSQNPDYKYSVYHIQFYKFKDGLYIKGISPEYSQYAGMKVTKIGKMKTEDALKKIAEIIPRDNELGIDWQTPRYLTYSYALYGLDINDSKNLLKLELEDGNGKKINAEIKVTQDVAPVGHSQPPPNYVFANEKSPNELPLYLRKQYEMFSFEHLKDINFLYMQVNGIQNAKDEKLKDFYERAFRYIDSNNVEGIIIDLRLNSGGNNQLNKHLVNNLIKREKLTKSGKIFTIIGRNTFSAAMNLVGDLENNTQTIFIGEPTGSKPNFVGEINFIDLPYSGFRVSASSLYWQKAFSNDKRKWVFPNIYTPLSFSDYKNNIDPAMNAVYDYLKYLQGN